LNPGAILAIALWCALARCWVDCIMTIHSRPPSRDQVFAHHRGVKPRRPEVATRVSLALLSRLFDWRTSLVVVRPETELALPKFIEAIAKHRHFAREIDPPRV